MRDPLRWWRRFWFEPTPPTNLGICRVLFYGAFFLYYLPYDFSTWAAVPREFWDPIWLFQRLHLPILSADALTLLQAIWKTALALSCVGLLTRLSTSAAFFLGLYLIGLPQNVKTEHHDTVVVLILGIMALSRCGDAISVDVWLKRRREAPGASGEYLWPVRAVWLLMVLVFFAAGLAKVRHSGLDWVFSDLLSTFLIRGGYHLYSVDPVGGWGLSVAQYEWLCWTLAGLTLTVELAFPLVLFSERARWVLVPSMFLMLVGFRVLLGPSFVPYWICFLFWVPWDRLQAIGRGTPDRLRKDAYVSRV
jgi:hypothetical protein